MPQDFDQLRQFFERGTPFNAVLGLQIERLEAGRAWVRMPFRQELVGDTERPAWHGAALAALIDSAAGLAVVTQLEPRDDLASVDLRIDYLRPAPAVDVVAASEIRRMGRRVAVVNVLLYPTGPDSLPVAEGRGIFHVRRGDDG